MIAYPGKSRLETGCNLQNVSYALQDKEEDNTSDFSFCRF